MRKKNTTPFFIVIVGILLIVGIVFGTGLFQVFGFTTVSLSQASFTSNSEFFTGNQWILTVVQGGMGQKAQGTITNDEIGSKSGTYSQNDFEIDITYSKQQCEYPIQKTEGQTKLRDYFWRDWICTLFNCPHPCNAQGADEVCGIDRWVTWGSYVLGSDRTCFCIEASDIASEIDNTLSDKYVRTISTIEVSNGNSVDSFEIDTKGNSRGFINNNVYVIWNGDLLFDRCTDMNDYYAYYSNGWHIGNKNEYDSYVILDSQLDEYVQSVWDRSDAKQLILNKLSEIARQRDKALASPNIGTYENQFSMDGAKFVREMSSWATKPLYTFYVRADYLKIYQPTPSISITQLTSEPFRTNGFIKATLYNSGEQGNIRVWAKCGLLAGDSPTQEVGIREKQSLNVYLPLSANTDTDTKETCTVYANDGFKTVSKDIEVQLLAEEVCTPGEKRCDTLTKDIMKCNSAGSGWDTVEECDICLYDGSGNPYCEEDGIPSGGGFGLEEDVWFLIILGIGVAIIAISAITKAYRKRKK